ncbi:MAG: hypothetical protein ACPG7F_11945 [Aggregatilineales bacterium]
MQKILLRFCAIILILIMSAIGLAQDSSFDAQLTLDGDAYTAGRTLEVAAGQTIEVRVVFFDDIPENADYDHTLISDNVAFRIENTAAYMFTSSISGELNIEVDSPVEGELRIDVFDDFYSPDDINPLQILDDLNESVTRQLLDSNDDVDLNETDLNDFAAVFEVDLNSAQGVNNHTLRIKSPVDADIEDLVLISDTDDILQIQDFSDLVLAFSPRTMGTYTGYILNGETSRFDIAIIDEYAVTGLTPPDTDDNNTTSSPPLPGAGGPPALRMVYDKTNFTITNVSGDIIDLNDVIFTGDEGELSIDRWLQYLSVPLDTIREGRCLQVYTFGTAIPPQPLECDSALAWFSTGNQAEWFWMGDFDVIQGDENLGNCPAAPGDCMIRLP